MWTVPAEFFTHRPTIATSAVVPGARRSQSREPALLRTTPISPRTPTGTPNLEPPASTSGSTGGLTFHLPWIHNTSRDGTSHRVSSQLCAECYHILAQADLAARVLGLITTAGHLCCFFFFLLTFYCVSVSSHFLRWDFSVINGGPVLYLIYLIFAKKKFIVQKKKNLHLVVLGQETVDCVMRWWRRVFELLSNVFLVVYSLWPGKNHKSISAISG